MEYDLVRVRTGMFAVTGGSWVWDREGARGHGVVSRGCWFVGSGRGRLGSWGVEECEPGPKGWEGHSGVGSGSVEKWRGR